MLGDTWFTITSKRRRVTGICSMVSIADISERFGREIRVFETMSLSPSPNAAANTEQTDDFYEFTAEDYYEMVASKMADKFMKTRKIREAEEAARRSRMTKAVIRVRFPDNQTLEATFHSSETIQSLINLLNKLIAQPEQPFYIYTTPPKKVIKDMSQDFYSAGFCPGAIVYFSYDVPKGDSTLDRQVFPHLLEEVMSLKGLEVANDQGKPSEPVQSAVPVPAAEATRPIAVEERKPAEKKFVKPKWLKM
ncbi:plant UBX domain-containing protein 1-like isoform X2 [Lotus japonicus]|uniref:plant UBX domain-containing protein 1-like isoform X2 n=1 Tax=Lotus japonicus TaxID=34305 RepID=UPI002584AEB9|nr:plant UBX domain-containing protein 1-like isoform X2 [Lotus japonicus]